MPTLAHYLSSSLARARYLIILMTLMLNQLSLAADQEMTTAKQIIDEMENMYRGNSSEASITMLIETPNSASK